MSERDYTRVCFDNGEGICEDMSSPNSLIATEISGLELQTNISSDSANALDCGNPPISQGFGPLPVIELPPPMQVNLFNYVQGSPYNTNAVFSIGDTAYSTEWEFLEAYSSMLDGEFGYSSDSSSSALIPLPFLSSLIEETEDDLAEELSEIFVSEEKAVLIDPYDPYKGRIFEAASGSGEGFVNFSVDETGVHTSYHNVSTSHGSFNADGDFVSNDDPGGTGCGVHYKTKKARAQGEFYESEYHDDDIGTFQDAADGAYVHGYHDCYEDFDGVHTPDVSENGDFFKFSFTALIQLLKWLWFIIVNINRFTIVSCFAFILSAILAPDRKSVV